MRDLSASYDIYLLKLCIFRESSNVKTKRSTNNDASKLIWMGLFI